MREVMQRTADAMVAEGCPLTGVLYGGLMKTRDGVKVIEFNARFGDPETEVVLPLLRSDIFDIFYNIAEGAPVGEVEWSDAATLGVVVASKGYPGSYDKGFVIRGTERAGAAGCRVYHMGTALRDGELVTAGGRVAIVVAEGETLAAAREKAYEGVAQIGCDNLFHRGDIGNKAFL